MTQSTEPRVVVTWQGAGEPITLTVHGPDGNVGGAPPTSIPLTPMRALELARELIKPAVATIKVNQWGPGWPG